MTSCRDFLPSYTYIFQPQAVASPLINFLSFFIFLFSVTAGREKRVRTGGGALSAAQQQGTGGQLSAGGGCLSEPGRYRDTELQ